MISDVSNERLAFILKGQVEKEGKRFVEKLETTSRNCSVIPVRLSSCYSSIYLFIYSCTVDLSTLSSSDNAVSNVRVTWDGPRAGLPGAPTYETLRRHRNNRKYDASKLRFPRGNEFLQKLSSSIRARAYKKKFR